MKPSHSLLRAGIVLFSTLLSLTAWATEYTVNTVAALQTAIDGAVPGDVITMQNGTYTTTGPITISRVGTAASPILITAQTIGGVTITGAGGFRFASPAAYTTIKGFNFFHSGSINMPAGTSHCRITASVIELSIPTGSDVSYINISGDDHEIDHNELRNKATLGEMLDIAGSGSQVARRLWIHHNYFHDFISPGGNGAETIRFGLSGLSLSDGFGLVEYNLFVRCNGENEMISNKSSSNTYRYNTVLDCPGGEISQRHGNDCLYYGNYMKNSGGMRIYGDRHQIFSNYLEGNSIGINMGNGDGDVYAGDPLTSHDRPDDNVVVFNTLINNGTAYQMGGRTGGLGATNTVFANNIIQGGTNAVTISTSAPYTNPVWGGNMVWNVANGPGVAMPEGTYTVVDPRLAADANGIFHIGATSPAIDASIGSYNVVTFDLDGQPRPATGKDVGADEFSSAPITARILTPADVGPTGGPTKPVIPPLVFESENLSFSGTGAPASVSTETTASGGTFASNFKYVALAADGDPAPPTGEYVEFVLPGVPAGTYTLKMRYKSHPTNRGILRLSFDGVVLGNDLNERASSAYRETTFGVVRLADVADHIVRLAVVGKDASAATYSITSDTITLVPDKTEPYISVPGAITVPATGAAGASVTFSVTAADDMDGPVPVALSAPSGSIFPIGTTNVSATASDFGGNVATANFDITVTPSYASWADVNGLSAANNDGAADPDGDGIANVLEYYFHLNPLNPDAVGQPVANVEGDQLVYRFNRATSASNVSQRVLVSNDLVTWTLAPSAPTLESTSEDVQTYIVKLPLTGPKLFVRIEVTATPAAPVATVPLGVMRFAVPAGSVANPATFAFGLPLDDTSAPPAGIRGGKIEAFTSNSISNNTAGWTANLASPSSPWLVRLTSGPWAGKLLDITSNTASTLTVSGADLSNLGLVPGVDTFELVPIDTLASLFGSTTLLGAPAPATADNVLVRSGATWLAYFYDTHFGYWRRTIGPPTNANNVRIRPDSGVQIISRGLATTLTFFGRVPVTPFRTSINNSTTTAVHTGFPADATLGSLGLQNLLPGWRSSNDSSAADTVYVLIDGVWTGYYFIGSNWLAVADGTISDTIPLPAGTLLTLQRAGSSSGTTELVRFLPYSL